MILKKVFIVWINYYDYRENLSLKSLLCIYHII